MKKKKRITSLYKQPVKALETTPETTGAVELREVFTLPGVGLAIPVRAAKAKFSALLDLIAAGQEIVITSDGKPKAKLVKAEREKPAKVFAGMGDYLLKQPIHRGMSADEAVSQGRGEW
jgi:prevent-host-death family protein